MESEQFLNSGLLQWSPLAAGFKNKEGKYLITPNTTQLKGGF